MPPAPLDVVMHRQSLPALRTRPQRPGFVGYGHFHFLLPGIHDHFCHLPRLLEPKHNPVKFAFIHPPNLHHNHARFPTLKPEVPKFVVDTASSLGHQGDKSFFNQVQT